MNGLKLSPVIISLLLLGAHFFRTRYIPLVIICFILLFLLLAKRGWVARLVQIALVAGSFEWIRTAIYFACERQDAGYPWIRLAVILGSVALFTGLSAFVFQSSSLKERYGLK